MEKYFENINFKRIYSLIVWIMFGLFGAFFIIFSVNGKTKFIFFALVTLWIACMMYFITELKSSLIQLFFFITLWLFLFSRPMIDYIQTKSFATYNANTYQFSFFVIILSMIGLLIGGVIGKNFKLRSKTPRVDVIKEQKYEVHIKYIRFTSLCFFGASFPFYLARIVERYMYRRTTTYYDYYATFTSKLPYIVYLISVFMFFSMCVYLATKPKKKHAFIVLAMYVMSNGIYLLIGTRNPFILSLLFALIYYCMRQFSDKKEVWIGKVEKTLIIASVPVLMLGMGAMNYLRDDAEVATNGIMALLIDFIYKQGTSFGVLAKGYLYECYLPVRAFKKYTFGPIIDYFYRGNIGGMLFGTTPLPENNSIELAFESNSYAHNISYIVMGDDYLQGHGIGSSYIMELFTDYRYIGVFVFSIILGIILVAMMKLAYAKKVLPMALSLVMLQDILFTPRASFMSSFMPLFTVQFWIVMFVIFFGATMLERYTKSDYEDFDLKKEK